MADDFLIFKGNISDKSKESDDLQTIHIYRGRFLHWMSIIETIMKEYCQIQSKMMYGQLKYKFICKLKEDFKIDEEFDKFVKDRNEHYNSEQLKFLRLLEQVFARTKHIELKSFAEHPLAEGRPLDVFSKEQLLTIVQKCNRLKWK